MLVFDSPVRVDFFNGQDQPAADLLAHLLDNGNVRIGMPDRVLFEVLCGFLYERDLRTARQLMIALAVETPMDVDLAIATTEYYPSLRGRGHTVRNAIDVLAAAFCIERDDVLLHGASDFDAFELRRGLGVWRH